MAGWTDISFGGHVDQTATCIDIKDAEGSWYFTFQYAFDKEMAKTWIYHGG